MEWLSKIDTSLFQLTHFGMCIYFAIKNLSGKLALFGKHTELIKKTIFEIKLLSTKNFEGVKLRCSEYLLIPSINVNRFEILQKYNI